MQKLTKEQAIILTGFTGVKCCSFSDFQRDVENRLGCLVSTNQLGDQNFMGKIKALYQKDFLSIVGGVGYERT